MKADRSLQYFRRHLSEAKEQLKEILGCARDEKRNTCNFVTWEGRHP